MPDLVPWLAELIRLQSAFHSDRKKPALTTLNKSSVSTSNRSSDVGGQIVKRKLNQPSLIITVLTRHGGFTSFHIYYITQE